MFYIGNSVDTVIMYTIDNNFWYMSVIILCLITHSKHIIIVFILY